MSKPKYTYFFVRGFMRSGTNWVGNLLNLHPRIACTGEFHLHRMYESFERITNPNRDPHSILMQPELRLPARREFERFARRIIELGCSQLDKPQATILGDRTPCLINRNVIRTAKKIHIVRDGRDCLVSSAFHFLRLTGTDYPFEDFPSMREKRKRFQQDPELFQQQPEQLLDDEDWVRSRIQAWARRYRLDRKFIKRHQDRVFCTSYEELHDDTEKVRGRMYEFLGADPALAAPLNDRTSAGFKSENLLSHYRKGQVGDWRRFFNDAICRWFQEEAADVLRDAGYEKDGNWSHL